MTTTQADGRATAAPNTDKPDDRLPAWAFVFMSLVVASSCFLAVALLMHISRRNILLIGLTSELLVLNCFSFVNLIIWKDGNSDTWWNGQGLCDIEIKLYLGMGQSLIGIVASLFARLAVILDTKNSSILDSASHHRRRVIFETIFCCGVPLLPVLLHIVVQPNRYVIDRFAGCRLTWHDSWLSALLLWIWYPVVCVVALYYTGLTLLRLYQHRRDYNSILTRASSSTHGSYFIRLLGLSLVLLLGLCPVTIYFFVFNVSSPNSTAYSWAAAHPPGWSHDIEMNADASVVPLDRWIQTLMGFLVFCFFGLGKDALASYARGLRIVLGTRSDGTSSRRLSNRQQPRRNDPLTLEVLGRDLHNDPGDHEVSPGLQDINSPAIVLSLLDGPKLD